MKYLEKGIYTTCQFLLYWFQFELHFYIGYKLRSYQLLVILPVTEMKLAAQATMQELNCLQKNAYSTATAQAKGHDQWFLRLPVAHLL